MVGGRDVGRVLAQPLAPLDVGVDGLALDRPRPHERDLGQMSSSVSGRVRRMHLHLRAALDLEVADGVRPLDLGDTRPRSSSGMRERSIVSPRSARPGRRTSSTAESIPSPSRSILRKPASDAGVLVPLAHLPARHRARHHRDELDERPRRDHHPARVLRDVPRQPGDLAAELAERAPARRRELVARPRAAARAPRPTRFAFQPSETRASRSSSPNGSPSALPRSRIAPRER